MSAVDRMPVSWRAEYVKLCASLRNAREDLSLSQDKVSAKIGVGLRTLVRWEAGETSPDAMQLFRWADIVGVEITCVFHSPKTAQSEAAA